MRPNVLVAVFLAGCTGVIDDVSGPGAPDPDPDVEELAHVPHPTELRVAGGHGYVLGGFPNGLHRFPITGGVPDRLDDAPMMFAPVSSGVWAWSGGDIQRLTFHPTDDAKPKVEVPGWVSHLDAIGDVACIAWAASPIEPARLEVRRGSDPDQPTALGSVPALAALEARPDGTCVARTRMGEALLVGPDGSAPIATPTPIAQPAGAFVVLTHADGWDYGLSDTAYDHLSLLPRDPGESRSYDTIWRGRPGYPSTDEQLVHHALPASTVTHTDVRALAFAGITVADGWLYFTTLSGDISRKPLPPAAGP